MTLRRLIPILAAVLFLWNLWGHDLWAPDEPYFAEGAREMLVDGKWIVPHVDGVVTTDKPPFFFWSIAVLSLPTGSVSSFTARLPSVLAALGSLLLTLRLGRRLYGEQAAAYAGILLAVNYLFWDKARSAQTDALLAFFILTALSAFEAFRAGDAAGRPAGWLFWSAAALAVLTKGPVGFLLPLGIVVATLLVDREPRKLLRFAPLSGPLLFVVILLCWVVPANLWDPAQYTVWGALDKHFVQRAIHGMHHVRPPWYYLGVLPVKLLPWSALVPGALIWAWRRRDPGDRLLLVTIAFVVLFFSVSTEKRDLYVLPALPAFALITASLLDRARAALDGRAARPLSPRWISVPQWLTGLAFVGAGIAVVVLHERAEGLPRWVTAVTGGLLLVTGSATLLQVARGRALRSVWTAAGGLATVYLFVATCVLPALDPVKSARGFSELIRLETAASRAAGKEIVAYWLLNVPEAFAYYTDGVYFKETEELEVLVDHLRRPEKVFAVIDNDRRGELPPDVRARLVTVAQRELSRLDVALVHNGGTAPDS